MPAGDEQEKTRLRALLLDDRSAVGAGAARPQTQHWELAPERGSDGVKVDPPPRER
jgi:hypothetical protein